MSVPVTDTTFEDIQGAIMHGDMDDHLNDIYNAITQRRDVVGQIRFDKLKVGDEVRFASHVNKGLAGMMATVVDKKRTRVVLKAENGKEYVGSPALLELA